MGLQLIFVVETNSKCKSDWIYIKDTIENFYQYNHTQLKLSVVYMDGKGKYKKKEKEIASLRSQYQSVSKMNETKVIYCFDCDEYDVKQEDADFLKSVQQYCKEKAYEFVWFCKDIESVYLGKKIADGDKKREATLFKAHKEVKLIKEHSLLAENYKTNSSNIMNVLDKYLERK